MKTPIVIGEDTIVTQMPGLVAVDMGNEEKAMLNIQSGKYYGLDDIGSRIWELIEKPRTVHELVVELLIEYEVDEKACLQSVLTFLNKLNDEGLIKIVSKTSKFDY